MRVFMPAHQSERMTFLLWVEVAGLWREVARVDADCPMEVLRQADSLIPPQYRDRPLSIRAAMGCYVMPAA
jgi:hypothetical protein